MGSYSVPKEIRAMRPAGTIVKVISNRYYVYEYSSTKTKIVNSDGSSNWKTSTKMGKCIGQITLENGFIPNSNALANSNISILEYGKYAFLLEYSKNTLQRLNKVFNAKDSNQIYTIASIFVVEGFTHTKNISNLYKESILSLEFPDVHTSVNAISKLYRELGRRGELTEAFGQALLEQSSKKIAIDGHVIACASSKNDLSNFGYKSSKLGSEQINWMTVYDIEAKSPLTSYLFNGSCPDKTAIQVMFNRFDFKDTLFVVDRGFNTEINKNLMSGNGNSYILPMVQGRKDYETVYMQLTFDKRKCFVYDKDGYSSLIYYREYTIDNYRYIAYQDTTRASAEKKTYMKKLSQGKKGYTEEGLVESEKDFGLFLLETSDKKKTAIEVFSDYKSRWSIETFYEYVDNRLDFNTIYQQDYCSMQGLSFIVQIAGMIYHDLRLITDQKHLSLRDLMNELKALKASKEHGRWVVRNDTKQKRLLCERAGWTVPFALYPHSPT